ncbi:MAG: DNA polymerase III subunit delta [Planctomycetes bacterium]|nr:DNA polymerase III subunit delta [Planctomycetota bacterium]
MLFAEFLKQIKSCSAEPQRSPDYFGAQTVPPLYIFTGPAKQVAELKEKGLGILSRLLTGVEVGESVRRFDTANFNEPEFWTELYAVPFLNKSRLVLLSAADKTDFINKMEKPLSDYLSGQTFFTRLVIFADKCAGFSAPFSRLLDKKGWIIECEPIREENLPGWIASQLNIYNKKISLSAAGLLAEKTGNDLARIDAVLKKLVLFHKDDGIISAESIRDFVDTEKDFDIKELSNAIINRQPDLALKVANQLLRKGESVNRILGFLRGAFAYNARYRNNNALLLSRYNKLLAADLAIKTGRLPEDLALQTLVVKLSR